MEPANQDAVATEPTKQALTKNNDEFRLTSRLECPPCELRQQIYLYLGFPVAGKFLHNCDEACVKM
ncbi:hypothetical protein BU23DRAFT_556931 [Bimuria novae-zelandiae CBS 107.79]|uniref:Uncharacterized protein n=1 Tax=Bimuria novae-zelandiae CBS 107.79 TaxID=1447943 RepID=A0A6A5UZT7_9PLEO|nr:hypothetical protein BU23DRAFT_556931 [Bimuria novae-zelandiae CBS 107.79]